MGLRIGTSGWVYGHWRGRFYPPELPQGAWFAHYARAFDTVEINNSFYRLPAAATFDAWREQAPPGFLYAVKASRFLTHMKKLADPEEPLGRFFERAARLGGTLGPILYQLPPRWRVNLPRFEAFLAALPPGYRHVVEFRDASWLREEVFHLMERRGVAHCLHDMRHLEVPARHRAAGLHPLPRRSGARRQLPPGGARRMGRAHRRVAPPGARRLRLLQQRHRRLRPRQRADIAPLAGGGVAAGAPATDDG